MGPEGQGDLGGRCGWIQLLVLWERLDGFGLYSEESSA